MTRQLPHGATATFAAWTEDDDARLRAAYTAGGIKAARSAFPDRTTSALYHRAIRLKLKRRRRWTTVDDTKLRRLWDGEQTLRQIANALDRTPITTYWRAQKLGLPLGCPEGWESLTDAAKRTGYGPGQLRRILAAFGVEPSKRVTRILPLRGKRREALRWTIVWPADVDAAVEAWCECDTLEGHARRREISTEALRSRLAAVGIERPVDLPRKHHWRLSEAEVDRALSGGRKAA